jgi:hypothetical protein
MKCLWDDFVFVEKSKYEVLIKIYIKNDYFNKIDINLENWLEDNFIDGYLN